VLSRTHNPMRKTGRTGREEEQRRLLKLLEYTEQEGRRGEKMAGELMALREKEQRRKGKFSHLAPLQNLSPSTQKRRGKKKYYSGRRRKNGKTAFAEQEEIKRITERGGSSAEEARLLVS